MYILGFPTGPEHAKKGKVVTVVRIFEAHIRTVIDSPIIAPQLTLDFRI